MNLVKSHPWRPCKQPNMSFSIDPVAFHDITRTENNDESQETDPISSMKRNGSDLSTQSKQLRVLNKTTSDTSNNDTNTSILSGPLLGGTGRSRRMVTNNTTIQSAYMCL